MSQDCKFLRELRNREMIFMMDLLTGFIVNLRNYSAAYEQPSCGFPTQGYKC